MICITDKKNMGVSRCNKLPQTMRSMITTPIGFSCTPEQAIDPDFWQDACLSGKATRIYIWPDFVNVEDKSEEAVYEQTPLATLVVRDGRYQYLLQISQNLCLHKAMFTHRQKNGRVFIFDIANQLFCTEDSDGNLRGFSIQLLHTEKLKISNGQVATKSPIYLALENNLEIDEHGVLIDAAFINDLDRLTDVTLEVISAADDEIVVKVYVACDGTPLNGLVKEDFVLLKADGDVQAIVALTEDDGTYTLTGVAWVTGSIDLVAAADLSVTAYESTGEQTVTIV